MDTDLTDELGDKEVAVFEDLRMDVVVVKGKEGSRAFYPKRTPTFSTMARQSPRRHVSLNEAAVRCSVAAAGDP